jgi:hypothetical protein
MYERFHLSVTFFHLCLGSALAQTSRDLIGTWHAESNGVSIVQTINTDGTYTFEAKSQSYFEEGTWQLDGSNFSQQWQDAQTGEAQQATYTLEFLGIDTFQQSGGNLNGEVYTFSRMNTGTNTQTTPVNPLSTPTTTNQNSSTQTPSTQTASTSATPITLLDKSTLVKLPPPETGEYTCSSSNVTFGTTYDLTGNVGDTLPVYGVNTMESLVGNLMLDGNGTYTVTKTAGAGTYTFDAASNQLSFTGELAAFPIDYFVTNGFFTIRLNFLDANNQAEASLSCSLESANAASPTTATPNPGLPGTLGLHTSDEQIITFVAETGSVQLLGVGVQPYQAANGETIFFKDDGALVNTSEFLITGPDGTLTAKLPVDDSEDCITADNIFGLGCRGGTQASEPVLSPDSTLIAYSSTDDLGTQNVMVRRRNASGSELIAVIPDVSQPSWTSDGGLIMAGGARATGSLSNVEGIYRMDPSFSNLQAIGATLISPQAPTLSPDGTTIAFLENTVLWLMNSDGSNPRPLVNQMDLELYGYPAWSPDGQWLAVAAAEPNFEAWTWILVLPVNGNTKQAQRLVLPTLAPLIINRSSRITWH